MNTADNKPKEVENVLHFFEKSIKYSAVNHLNYKNSS